MHYHCFTYLGYKVHIKSSDTVPESRTDIAYIAYGIPNREAFEVLVSPALWNKVIEHNGTDALVTGFQMAIQQLIAKNHAPMN